MSGARAARLLGPLFLLLATLKGLPLEKQQLLLDAAKTGDLIVAVGDRGAIIRSVDSGVTWSRVSSPASATLTCIAFSDATTGWAAGHDGKIYKTADGGATWVLTFAGDHEEPSFLSLATPAPGVVLAGGSFGAVERSLDSGAHWAPLGSVAGDAHLYSLQPLNTSTLLVAGERGTLLLGSSKLTEASSVAPLETPSLHGTLVVDEDRILAFGLQGHVFRSEDQGRTWTEVDSGSKGLLSTGVILPDGSILLAGQARNFVLSRDKGLTWEPLDTGLTTAVAKLLLAAPDRLLAFGEDGVSKVTIPEGGKH